MSETETHPPLRAAAYVRMSTEHQQYSTDNQMDGIRQYAMKYDLEIVKVYSDEGKSGLNIKGRSNLLRMLADVQGGDGCVTKKRVLELFSFFDCKYVV